MNRGVHQIAGIGGNELPGAPGVLGEMVVFSDLDREKLRSFPPGAVIAQRRPEHPARLSRELPPLAAIRESHPAVPGDGLFVGNETIDLISDAAGCRKIVVVPMKNDRPMRFGTSKITLLADFSAPREVDKPDPCIIWQQVPNVFPVRYDEHFPPCVYLLLKAFHRLG